MDDIIENAKVMYYILQNIYIYVTFVIYYLSLY